MTSSRPLKILFFTVFADLIGFGILIPVIPLLLANPSSRFYLLSTDDSSAEGYLILGLLTSVFPLSLLPYTHSDIIGSYEPPLLFS